MDRLRRFIPAAREREWSGDISLTGRPALVLFFRTTQQAGARLPMSAGGAPLEFVRNENEPKPLKTNDPAK